MAGYIERIRRGEVAPWVGEGVAGAVASAGVARDEADTLPHGGPRWAELRAQIAAWEDVADVWAREQEHRVDEDKGARL